MKRKSAVYRQILVWKSAHLCCYDFEKKDIDDKGCLNTVRCVRQPVFCASK